MRKATGTPTCLVISTDVGKGIEGAIDYLYPGVEHRECMGHLWKNMKKSAAKIRFAGSGRGRVSASASETVTRDAGSGKKRGRSESLFGCIISCYLVLWVCLVREKFAKKLL